MRASFSSSSEFGRLIRGAGPISLERVALEIALDAYPELDPQPITEQLDELADRVRSRSPKHAGTRAVLAQLRWVLHVEEGFRGDQDHYHEAANSYLNEVLDRKRGIPITLSLLYLALAQRLDLPLAGVSLPAHFMLRVMDQPIPLFVDAFHEGKLLDLAACEEQLSKSMGIKVQLASEQLQPCQESEFVARMLRNLREIYLREGNFIAALPVLRRLSALEPSNTQLLKDWGVVALQSGHPGEAIGPLEASLTGAAHENDRTEIERLTRIARRQQAEMN